MSILNFLHYFLANLLGFGIIPRTIKYEDNEYFSLFSTNFSGKHYLSYLRYLGRSTKTEELIVVSGKYEYFVYLKMVYQLWKWRKYISFSIDDY